MMYRDAPHQPTKEMTVSMTRPSGRTPDALRKVSITRNFTRHAEGSVLVCFGDTQVICTASVEDRVPSFLRDRGEGWLTAEYGMLPRATHTRSDREAARGKQSGRTQEIQRLIGRSLRAVTDLRKLGPRTAGITGAFVAVHDAIARLLAAGAIEASPLNDFVAAVSVGIYKGTPVLDLDYAEDSACDTDMNVVMTGAGGFVEVQGTAEGVPFSRTEMNALLGLAENGIAQLITAQKSALGSRYGRPLARFACRRGRRRGSPVVARLRRSPRPRHWTG